MYDPVRRRSSEEKISHIKIIGPYSFSLLIHYNTQGEDQLVKTIVKTKFISLSQLFIYLSASRGLHVGLCVFIMLFSMVE